MKVNYKKIFRFWDPESGAIGGLIFGSIVGGIIASIFIIITLIF